MEVKSPRDCTYCAHRYANPCDGEDPTCGNKLFIDGKVPGVEPREDKPATAERVPLKPKRERVKLGPSKPKRERVQLKRPVDKGA